MEESIDYAKKFDLPQNIRVITNKNKVTRAELKLRGRLVGFSRDCDMMFLETLFWYNSGFYGATGYNMRTLEQSEIDNGRNVDGNGLFAEMWKCAVTNNNTTDSLSEFSKQMLSEAKDSGLFYPGDDDSFRYETEDAWDSLTDAIRELAARAMAAGKMSRLTAKRPKARQTATQTSCRSVSRAAVASAESGAMTAARMSSWRPRKRSRLSTGSRTAGRCPSTKP